MRTCPHCAEELAPETPICTRCKRGVLVVSVTPAPTTSAQILARLVWFVALLAIGFFALDGFFTFRLATTAPQQAAAAGMGCFQVIVPYVIARAITGILTR